MADIDVVVENLAELLTNTVDMATVFYDIFLNPEPMDVNIQMFNKENEFITVTIPNRAKDRITPYVGEGSPEGVVAAPIGSVYVDTASSTVYYKISGSGVDGWNPVLSQSAMEEFLISYLEDRGYITNASLVNYLVSNEYVTIPSLSTYLNVNGYIRSADLTPIETSPLVNKLIIITNDTTEPIKSMVLGDFIANEISTDLDNILTRGSDSKLYVSGDEIANKDLSDLSSFGEERLHALKGYKDEGEILTDAEGLADVISYAHSTFDASKFTVVGSPNITADGIVSGLSNDNYITISNVVTLNKNTQFTIEVVFETPSAWGSQGGRFWSHNTNNEIGHTASGKLSGKFLGQDINNSGTALQLRLNTKYRAFFIYDNTGWYVKFKEYTSDTWITSTPTTITSAESISLTTQYIGRESAGGYAFLGSIDLKYFSMTVHGIQIFSGNITSSDIHVLNGGSIVIPYTLSKTGSKIVDSVYRSNVTALYERQGYAPYYILDELGDTFTLPQGEVYGLGSIYTQMVKEAPAVKSYGCSIVGSLVNNNDVLSGFSSTNYALAYGCEFYPGNNPWEIDLKFTTGSDVVTRQFINSTLEFTTGSTEVEIWNGHFVVDLSSDGETSDIGEITGSYSVLPNTTYWVKLMFTGSQYLFSYSTNGVSFNNDIVVNNSTPVRGYNDITLGVDYTPVEGSLPIISYTFLGSIDLKGCSISIANTTTWQGALTTANNYPTRFNPAVVVDSWVNGSSWYRVYSDGWCEQGGISVENATIVFIKPFINNSYLAFGISRFYNQNAATMYDNKQRNSIIFRIGEDTEGYNEISWYACGYIS